ncbi:beta-phosphoglucomutase [Alkalibacterium putridalgicola]|uniref:Beta-phosphoglucomutase n=1 Tax=Alkalibacterium putridalgicola TaxID=426703 RepID=A0A1H7UEJ4_9LACT|nr:beta-phosphoglucomutase [Alkalibacterium putridalgicola]GEK89584.1 beta-phosphoglucomutase [Alkalibacterium putridalgicola]SEL95229.1 beta-phosphoglucomutase [Alkalibacterium putridalgicola]
MIKGLIFDLDGVITDTAEYHYLAWKSLAKKLGIEMDREFNEQLKGISRMESLDLILKHGNKENDYTEEEKQELATQKNEEYQHYIEEITHNDLLPGIETLLKEAKEKGIGMALASASKNGPKIIRQLEIDELFDGTVVDPASLSAGKPDPEIFIKGAEVLGLKPEECVGLEDAEAGVESINAAGMFSVGVGSEAAMHKADYIVKDTKELTLDKILEAAEK